MPTEIVLPVLSSDTDEVMIDTWYKSIGDSIAPGDIILSVETDKAVVEIEAVVAGVLGKILCEAGTEGLTANAIVGYLLDENETDADLEQFVASQADVSIIKNELEEVSLMPEAAEAAAVEDTSVRIFASPLARRIAGQSSIDLSLLSGSGPNGRILKVDVERAQLNAPQPKSPQERAPPQQIAPTGEPGSYVAIPHTTMRKTIARRLSESKRDVPHFYLSSDFEIDALLKLRQEANELSPKGEDAYKLSVNDFIIKACAFALRDVPAVNASWTETAIHQYNNVDIAVAVATSGGLITPIVRNADLVNMMDLSREVTHLAAKARDGKLSPAEYQGGGFSISNLGMYGVKEFSAIINPPQSCILAVGGGEQRPVVKDGQLAIATIMTCTLSSDHRSVDGAVAAEFMQALKAYIEKPLCLLLKVSD